MSQGSGGSKSFSPWKIRLGAIPKIPGLKRKEYKKNKSKELDQVLENEELDISSPKKNQVIVTSFADAHRD